MLEKKIEDRKKNQPQKSAKYAKTEICAFCVFCGYCFCHV